MPLPLVTDRPEKTIGGIVSRWNAGDLPLIYDVTNTKWPVNSEDSTVAITSISDDNGSARLNHGSSTGLVVREWVNVAGTTNYNGPHQITAVSGNNLTIDFPFGTSETGTSQKYFQNYTTLIRVNVGLDPVHEFVALKPNTLVGTIEQRPDTDNITLADVKEYVKNKLNTIYDESQASWPNDVNAWTDFYISFAERYDLVTAGVVGDFTSVFTDDTNVDGIIFLHAVHGALQFGDARGGNMFDFVVFDSTEAGVYFDGGAEFMTFFERLKIIDYNNFNISIILDMNAEYPDLNITRLQITEFDQNDNVLLISISAVPRQDYGLYRIDLNGIVFQDNTTDIEIVLLDVNNFEVSETKIIDVDVECFVDTPGPVLSIDAEFESVIISWTDIEADSYEVQRSTDNVTFATIATVSDLSFTDTTVTTGIFFYRIKAPNSTLNSNTVTVHFYDPTEFTSLFFRLNAFNRANLSFSSGDLIEEWDDTEGALPLGQTIVADQPILFATGPNSMSNRQAVVRIDGAGGPGDLLRDNDAAWATNFRFIHDDTTDYTMVFAVEPFFSVDTADVQPFGTNISNVSRGAACFVGASAHIAIPNQVQFRIRNTTDNVIELIVSVTDTDKLLIIVVRFDSTADEADLNIRSADGEFTGNAAALDAFSAGNQTTRHAIFQAGGAPDLVKMGQYQIWKSRLSDDDVDLILDTLFSYYSG